MCIAIFKPEGVILPENTLRNSFRNNPDGAGFMYVKNKELVIEKGFMQYSAFRKAYKAHEHKRVVLHFRATSHGATNIENTHPHRVNNKVAFVHNGIIRKVEVKAGTQDSDTVVFNEQMLQKLPENFLRFSGLRKLIEEYIGWSKLVFMTNTGAVYIFNAQQGEADKDGVWYSNDSYKDSVTKERRGKTLVYDEKKGDFVVEEKKVDTTPKNSTSPWQDLRNTTKALSPAPSNAGKNEPLAFDAATGEWYLEQYKEQEQVRVEHCGKCGAPMFRDTEQDLGYCSVCFSSAKCPECTAELSIEEIAYSFCSICKHSLSPEEQKALLPSKITGSEDAILPSNVITAHKLEVVSTKELTKRAIQMKKILVDKFEGA